MPLWGLAQAVWFKFIHGLVSASLWATIWLVTFVLSSYLTGLWHTPREIVNVTALALTITVISGHLPKLVSYGLGCDTDFRHISIYGINWEEIKLGRFFLSLLLLGYAVYAVRLNLDAAEVPFPAISETFLDKTIELMRVCSPIFVAQIVFSWPDDHEV